MSNEELDLATDIILKAILESELNIYSKVELMINLKKFLEKYENNINILRKER